MEGDTTNEPAKVTTKDMHNIMLMFEAKDVPEINDEDFIDVTDEILNAVDNELKDLEFICSDTFNFEETMTSFELNDTKMDLRKNRFTTCQNKAELLTKLEGGELGDLT